MNVPVCRPSMPVGPDRVWALENGFLNERKELVVTCSECGSEILLGEPCPCGAVTVDVTGRAAA